MSARIVGVVAMVVWAMVSGPAAAQSLGEVARKEAARRERIKSGGKVLTNADLPASAVVAPAQDANPDKAQDDGSTAQSAEGGTTRSGSAASPAASPSQRDDEEGWRGRAARINAALAEARAQARQLSALSDRLALEMQASDRELASRAARERDDVKAKLAQAEAAEAKAQSARDAFVQEARAAGVPPAWIQ
jgi:hypothetical protein